MLFQWVLQNRNSAYKIVDTKFQLRNFLKMRCLSCRKCSEDSKTFRGLKIGSLLRKLYACLACKTAQCYFNGFCKTEIISTSYFLKMRHLSCRKCSEDSKTFRRLKIGSLLRCYMHFSMAKRLFQWVQNRNPTKF